MLWPEGSDQVTWRNRLRCGGEMGASPVGIAASGSWNSGVEILASQLIRPDRRIGVARAVCEGRSEIEERLPPDEASPRASAAAQVDRVGLALPRRVEDHREEGRTVVAGQVRPVRGAHHRVAEAVRGALELDRDERNSGPVELAPAVKDLVDQRLADEQRRNSWTIIHW